LILAIRKGVKIENSNIEIRNPKQYQNFNVQNSKQTAAKGDGFSDFVIRILVI
jgi:hypothetical protein